MTTNTPILVACALLTGSLVGFAQSASVSVPRPPAAPAAAAPTAPPSALEKWLAQSKKPADWLTFGGDLRVRDEYYDNIFSLNQLDPLHEQNVIRYRARLWTSITPMTNISVNARLAAEPREWTRPAFVGAYRGRKDMEWRYGIADNLYVKWNNLLDQPLTFSAGRQDITFGDFWNWWLVADGTPGDGSWTYFLDSLRLTYDAKDLKTKFDLVYIHQNARPDELLPTFNRNQPAYGLTEQNEQGVIVYASNKSIKNTQVDGYFIYKRDSKEFANGDDADIYTLGARFTGTVAGPWQYSVEGAYQFGKKQDPTVKNPVNVTALNRDIAAYGANARLSYLFNDKLNNQAHLIFEYLSGDDPKTTGEDEMFDVLWGRWPRWSELYIYPYAKETSGKIAQLNNTERIGAGWTLVPMKGMTFGAYYNALFAPEAVPTRTIDAARFSGTGHFRGHYAQAILTHTFSKHLKGHLWGEFIWAGSYYTRQDLLSFLRAEVSLTW